MQVFLPQYKTVKHLMLHQKLKDASFFAQNLTWRLFFGMMAVPASFLVPGAHLIAELCTVQGFLVKEGLSCVLFLAVAVRKNTQLSPS